MYTYKIAYSKIKRNIDKRFEILLAFMFKKNILHFITLTVTSQCFYKNSSFEFRKLKFIFIAYIF